MKKITAGREKLGTLAPLFAECNDDVLFGKVWAREDKLDPKYRSMITISALMAMGYSDGPIRSHIEMGKENGITKEEIVEVVTQLAFYVGWPKAWGVFPIVEEVYKDE